MDERNKTGVDEMLTEWEGILHKSFDNLNEWATDAQELVRTRPGVMLGVLGIAGFMTGLLLRRDNTLMTALGREPGGLREELRTPSRLVRDPAVVFIAGACAGLTLGPLVVRQITRLSAAGKDYLAQTEDEYQPGNLKNVNF